MKALEVFRGGLRDGDTLLCVENTYIPRLSGTTRKITRVGKTVADCEMDGRPFRMEWPKRASDIVAVTESEITYRILRGEHTVTLRKAV